VLCVTDATHQDEPNDGGARAPACRPENTHDHVQYTTHIDEKTWFPREPREEPARRGPNGKEITVTTGSLYEYTSTIAKAGVGPRALVPKPQPQA